MKQLVVIAVVGWALALPALARFGERIDPTKRVNLTDKRADLPVISPGNVINLKTLPLNTRALPTSPVSGKVVTPGGIVDATMVPTEKREFEKPAMPVRAMPRVNFGCKRAPVSTAAGENKMVETGAAPITDRVIEATTPAGNAELQRQLNRR